MFKNSWEKINLSYQLSKDMVEEMVRLVYPHKKVLSHSLIAGGCANLNYKIQLEHKNQPLILRVYLRDKDAAYREQTLTALLKKDLPVPLTYAIGELAGQHFALTEYMPGNASRSFTE